MTATPEGSLPFAHDGGGVQEQFQRVRSARILVALSLAAWPIWTSVLWFFAYIIAASASDAPKGDTTFAWAPIFYVVLMAVPALVLFGVGLAVLAAGTERSLTIFAVVLAALNALMAVAVFGVSLMSTNQPRDGFPSSSVPLLIAGALLSLAPLVVVVAVIARLRRH